MGGKYVPGAAQSDGMDARMDEGWMKDRNLSGHSELQRDNGGVETAGRRRAELLLIRDSGGTDGRTGHSPTGHSHRPQYRPRTPGGAQAPDALLFDFFKFFF